MQAMKIQVSLQLVERCKVGRIYLVICLFFVTIITSELESVRLSCGLVMDIESQVTSFLSISWGLLVDSATLVDNFPQTVAFLLLNSTRNHLFWNNLFGECVKDGHFVGSSIRYGLKQGIPWNFSEHLISLFM